MVTISRRDYAALYGPTTGDAVRLGDTSLIAVVEHDHAVYGDECLHGGGKTLRDGIGLAAGVTSAQGALDLLLCNVVLIDPVLGIVKGDLGITRRPHRRRSARPAIPRSWTASIRA